MSKQILFDNLSEKVYIISVMHEKDYTTKIRNRVLNIEPGSVLTMLDFADIAPKNTANRIISRLVEEGTLRVIVRGIYQKPKKNNFLGEFEAPSVDAIAQALARKNGWTICPHGDTALNLLGLSTQVPSKWHYLSNGPYKNYKFGRGEIKFTHTANRMLENLSSDTVLIVQALRVLGESMADQTILLRLASCLSLERIEAIEKEARNVPDWIRTQIAQLKVLKNA